jgi:MFS family permease
VKRTPWLALPFAGRSKYALQHVAQRMPWYADASTQEGRNIRNLYIETAWFGLLNGLAVTFVSVFALRLGATTTQVGWLTALTALVNVIWLIPAARLIERQRRRIPLILTTGFLQRMGYLAMALMPLVAISGRVEALIAINTLITLPAAVINTAITALLPDLTTPGQRGKVVSTRWLLLSLMATIAALAGGRILDLMPVPLNYQVLFGAGAILSLLSLRYLHRIEVPDSATSQQTGRARERYSWARLRQAMGNIFSHRDFVRFSLASFIFYWGLYLPGALWSVLRVRNLAASDTWIGIIATIVNGSTIVGYLAWGKVTGRWGNRRVLNVTAVAVAAYALSTAAVPTIEWMIPTSILGGLAWSGCNLVLFNVMLGVSPDEHRPTYVAFYTALMNITAFAGPLLGAALSDWLGIRMAFVLSGGVRLVGAVLFWRMVREG